MTDFSLRAARIQLGALLAALALAIVIALGITTGAFVLKMTSLYISAGPATPLP